MAIPDTASGVVAYRDECDLQARLVVPRASGRGSVHTYTVEYDRAGEPTNIILILDLDKAKRTIANVERVSEVIDELLASEPIGRDGYVEHDPQRNRNFFRFTEN